MIHLKHKIYVFISLRKKTLNNARIYVNILHDKFYHP